MNKPQLAYASFAIYQDAESPEFWTKYFGVSPSCAGVKGQQRITPSGRISSFPWRQGIWSVTSKDAVTSDELTPHLRYLVNLLALPRPDLRELVERMNGQMRFFCYWENGSGDRIPDVPEDIQTMMKSLGGTVEVDEYR